MVLIIIVLKEVWGTFFVYVDFNNDYKMTVPIIGLTLEFNPSLGDALWVWE